jgi:uncharacterized protein (DUF302 family)
MLKRFLRNGLLGLALAAGPLSAEPAQESVVVYPASGAFDEVLENVKWAITGRGLLVSGTLHVQDMLARTGKDLGFPDSVYLEAESVEFCSAMMSQRMVAADPRNLVVCPFTVAVYVMVDEPEQVYVAYRRQQLAGDSGEVVEAVNEMLDGIAREAAE